MNLTPKLMLTAVAASAAVGCAHAPTPPPAAPAPVAAEPPPGPKAVERSLADVGLDASALDRTADPCQNFYQYACGGWLKKTEIPGDKAMWSRSFSEIDKQNEDALHTILEAARTSTATDEVTRKIGDFYGSCMDEAGVEATGTKPIEHWLKLARGIKDKKSALAAIIELHKYNVPVLFDLSSGQDGKDATKVIANLDQSGLGLPDRGFYLDDDEHSKATREFYPGHVARMLDLAGFKEKDAKEAAKDVMVFETELAKISMSRTDRRDPQKVYNKIDLAGVKKTMPNFPWDEYFKALGHPDITEINVVSPAFFAGLNDLIETTKPHVWRSYLEYHIIRAAAPALPKAFVDETFALTAKITGQKTLADRWKRCVQATDHTLGELLAQSFVQQKFGGESKTATQSMVGEIRDAFGRNLGGLDWMDEATRAKAADKLKAVSFLIGYPDKWKEYDFKVDPKNFAANAIASEAYELQRELNKIGKPVDRGEWDMTPPTVNAYYDPQKNQMVFPAGILQPPFFSTKSSVAVNLGGIGMVVGHELTHGFDDEGAQFDANGNLANWWAPAVGAKFQDKGKCLENQYGAFSPLPGVNLNGKLTEGENIADNGGVKLAFAAYRHLRGDAPERIVAEGFNEDQQFFLAVGQVWCTNARDEAVKTQAKMNPHSTPIFRVNGSLSNTKEFAEAFSCKEGTPMHPVNACRVW